MSQNIKPRDGWVLWDYGTNSPFYAEEGSPTVYPSERAAQLEIADWVCTRAQEFVDGDRDELDVECDAVAVPVTVYADGAISSEDFEISTPLSRLLMDLVETLRLCGRLLNSQPRFKVGGMDSYAVATEIETALRKYSETLVREEVTNGEAK